MLIHKNGDQTSQLLLNNFLLAYVPVGGFACVTSTGQSTANGAPHSRASAYITVQSGADHGLEACKLDRLPVVDPCVAVHASWKRNGSFEGPGVLDRDQ